jgi:asparagine synthase (glutamine-hydrolysing)
MCGIAGLLTEGAGAEASARAMAERIAHRGPDGIRVERIGAATLAHARLSIIDLECGWQPLSVAGSTVIGNGEIYNYKELIAEHGLADGLSTGSDFEPLLHLYGREGAAAFARLRGMYAFCLVGADGRTWLVRDRFGIKPLYVARREDGLAFASEPRALADRAAPSRQAAAEVLALGYLAGAETTVWPGVRRLPPGAVIEVEDSRRKLGSQPAGVGSEMTFAGPAHLAQAAPMLSRGHARGVPDEAATLAKLDAVLQDSVAVHQRSDVPYGLFLSGGIDSSAVATVMARLNTRPVTAFTCGFEGPGARDERAAAERVARALDLDWRETTFGEADFWRILPEVAWALDDPTTDYAILPTYKLAEAAKGTLTVVLSGEGGDELFGGYGRYRRALRPRWLGGRPAEPQVDSPFLNDGGVAALANWRVAARFGRPSGATPLAEAQAADIATWLPNDLLLKLDRCLMAHGLEGRTPFLDREVAAFALGLPDRFKVQGRYGKWLLRRWLERACPAAEPWARKKGFTVPVAGWIAPRAAALGPWVAGNEGVRAVCDAEAVRSVFADEAGAKHRWPLLFYATWWNIHVAGMAKAEAAPPV